MRRREFVAGMAGAAAWPLALRAQQRAMPVVGYLNVRAPGEDPHLLAAFRQGLKEAGFVEGQNVAIEYRFAAGQYDRLPALAADLVRRPVAVIATWGGPLALAAKAATATIPVVFDIGEDPVKLGLVASLNRPGGNLTGVTTLNSELGPKRLELVHNVVPTATVIALLVNPTNPQADAQSSDLQAAARMLGLQIHVLPAITEHDFDTVFTTLRQLRAAALVIGNDPFFISRNKRLAALTLRHAVPTISQFREFAVAGGLMSYGGNLADGYRLAGVHTGRILKGEKPADLPVVQSTKAELIINLRTAKTLGLTIPEPLLRRADEVIE